MDFVPRVMLLHPLLMFPYTLVFGLLLGHAPCERSCEEPAEIPKGWETLPTVWPFNRGWTMLEGPEAVGDPAEPDRFGSA